MIRLTPFAETSSGQELIKNERVKTLIRLVTRKFSLSPELAASIQVELNKLELETLQHLLEQVLDLDAVERLEQWIAVHQPIEG